MTNKEKHESDLQIIELRKNGMTMKEISQIVNLKLCWVQKVCKNNELGGVRVRRCTEEQREKARIQSQINGFGKKNTEEEIYQKCLSIGFEYISGYECTDSTLKLKCMKCNSYMYRRWSCVRKVLRGVQKNLVCDSCNEIKQEEDRKNKELNKLKRLEQAKEQKIEKEKEREKEFWEQGFNQNSFKVCKQCGEIFYKGKVYCSERCQRAYMNKQRKDRRLRKIKSVKIEYIDIKKLYARDKGICYLCGNVCDFEDYKVNDNGAFIAGNNYPSIDHVIPLARGGVHSWENVRLAHFICNSRKGCRTVQTTLPC